MGRLLVLFAFTSNVESATLGAPCKKSADCDVGEFCSVECFSKGCIQEKNVCQPCKECHEGADEVDGTCDKCSSQDDNDGSESEGEADGSEAEGEADGAESKVSKTGGIASKSDRHACPYYQHMQCLLDISEKACEPDEEPLPLLEWTGQESVWLCSCPLPYKACSKSAMNPVCLAAVGEHLSKAKVKSRSDMVAGLQEARGQM